MLSALDIHFQKVDTHPSERLEQIFASHRDCACPGPWQHGRLGLLVRELDVAARRASGRRMDSDTRFKRVQLEVPIKGAEQTGVGLKSDEVSVREIPCEVGQGEPSVRAKVDDQLNVVSQAFDRESIHLLLEQLVGSIEISRGGATEQKARATFQFDDDLSRRVASTFAGAPKEVLR